MPQLRYLGVEHGLSNNSVTSVYQDSHGFIWFGTNDGLNRFDGNKFNVYRHVWEDPSSLVNNHVIAITGFDNKVFVGTQKGLNYYDYADDKFHPIYYPQGSKQRPISENVNALVADKDGNVYVAAEHLGLLVYSNNLLSCKRISLEGTGEYDVQALTLDYKGNLWLFIKGVGLCRYDPILQKIEVVIKGLYSANCLESDAQGNIWVGTESGIFGYSKHSRKLKRLEELSSKLTNTNIFDLQFDEAGVLWIATNGGGVNILNLKEHTLEYIVPGQKIGALKSGAVTCIFKDQGSRRWIATLRGGVNILDSKQEMFKHQKHDPFNNNSVSSNFIISFCEDQFNNIWIGTDGDGLSYWNRQLGKFEHYAHARRPGSLSSNFVVSILNDHVNQIWVGTFNGGIDRYTGRQTGFKNYKCINPFTSTEDKNLWKLYEDSHHNIWAGTTLGGGLYLYNRKSDQFELFNRRLTNIHALFEDSKGVLWAGDYKSLFKINIQKKSFESIAIGHPVRSIVEDKQHRLWIATEGGGLLNFYGANKFRRFTQKDGLPSNSVLSVLADNKGNLWCSTFDGLTKFDPVTGRFKNFSVSDGLQSNQFSYNAALKLESGEMLFGGINGFNIFDPDSVTTRAREPEIRFTGVKIGGLYLKGESEYTNGMPIVSLQSMTIPFHEATIAIDYTALEFSLPDKISYAYFLEGWDRGWNYVGKLRTAYYTHLNEGNYTLHIKATDTEGNWGKTEKIIKVTILPPWYRTAWAYLLYLIMSSAGVYYIWLYQSRQTRLKYDIKLANHRVQQEKELNEKKIAFFTNISHEFRTPLMLIINPIKDLLSNNHDKSGELNLIYRNARRLLGLVDHLLQFRKAESENDALHVNCINFSELCNDVFLCFANYAKSRKIEFTLVCPEPNIDLFADRDKMEIVLFNLLSNAMKFTPVGGSISMTVEEKDEEVFLKIRDSGKGIDPNIGPMLFDKFYQVKDKSSMKSGFGIGLYLVKAIIESHQGTITYVRNETGGTTFNLMLKKGTAHLQECELSLNARDCESINENYCSDTFDGESMIEEESNNLELLISDKQSVLIIDDNKEIRDYVRKIFRVDFDVYEAENGGAGLDMIKRFLPDIVISDVTMEGLSGIDLCKAIKQDSSLSHIPVILLTGDSTPEIKLKGIEMGAIDFVSKPFETDLLIARVKGVLRNKKELQEYFYNEVTLKANPRNVSEEHKEFLYKCISIIENNLTKSQFDVVTLSHELAMSYSALYKKMKGITGLSVNGFIRYIRLRKAAELLIHTNCKVNEVAYKVGFTDLKYFRVQFTKQFSITPSVFIKKHRTAFYKTFQLASGLRKFS